jgi:hypothetical protein
VGAIEGPREGPEGTTVGPREGRRVEVKEGEREVLGKALGPVGMKDGEAVDGVMVGLVGYDVDGRIVGNTEGFVGCAEGAANGFKLMLGAKLGATVGFVGAGVTVGKGDGFPEGLRELDGGAVLGVG